MSITCSRSLNVRAGKADDFPPGYTARSKKRKLSKHPNDKYIHLTWYKTKKATTYQEEKASDARLESCDGYPSIEVESACHIVIIDERTQVFLRTALPQNTPRMQATPTCVMKSVLSLGKKLEYTKKKQMKVIPCEDLPLAASQDFKLSKECRRI